MMVTYRVDIVVAIALASTHKMAMNSIRQKMRETERLAREGDKRRHCEKKVGGRETKRVGRGNWMNIKMGEANHVGGLSRELTTVGS